MADYYMGSEYPKIQAPRDGVSSALQSYTKSVYVYTLGYIPCGEARNKPYFELNYTKSARAI